MKNALRRVIALLGIVLVAWAPSADTYAQAMKIETRQDREEDVVIVDLAGKLTIGEGDVQLRDPIKDLLDNGASNLLLNLGGVIDIDEAGIEELVRAHATVEAEGGALKLVNLPLKVTDLLQITKRLSVFEVFDNEDVAIASFNSN